jgi:hypothetical protein
MESDTPKYICALVYEYVQLDSLAGTSQIPPYPRIWAHIRGRYLVSQDKRHIFATPLFNLKEKALKTFKESTYNVAMHQSLMRMLSMF